MNFISGLLYDPVGTGERIGNAVGELGLTGPIIEALNAINASMPDGATLEQRREALADAGAALLDPLRGRPEVAELARSANIDPDNLRSLGCFIMAIMSAGFQELANEMKN